MGRFLIMGGEKDIFGPFIVGAGLTIAWIAAALLLIHALLAARRRMFSTFLLEHIRALTRLNLPLTNGLGQSSQRLSHGRQEALLLVTEGLAEGRLVGDALASVAIESDRRLGRWARFWPSRKLVSAAEAEVLRVGEISGNLPDALDLVVQERRRFAELRGQLVAEFVYPLVLAMALSGLFALLVLVVLPRYAQIFTEMDVPLPALSQHVMNMRHWAAIHLWILPIALLFLFIGFGLRHSLRRPFLRGAGRTLAPWVRAAYAIPFYQRSMRRAQLREFCRELAMLLRVGTPAHRALRVIAEGTLNPWFRERVRHAADLAERGVALGDAMDQAGVDRRAAWFARSLADRADLSEGLMRLGDDYGANFSWFASVAARTAPPMAIIAIGVLVACVVIGLYLPILKIMNSLGG